VAVFSHLDLSATGLHTVTGVSLPIRKGIAYSLGVYLASSGASNPSFRCVQGIPSKSQNVRSAASASKYWYLAGWYATADTPSLDLATGRNVSLVSSNANAVFFPVTLSWKRSS
jgi:hypothetical protein